MVRFRLAVAAMAVLSTVAFAQHSSGGGGGGGGGGSHGGSSGGSSSGGGHSGGSSGGSASSHSSAGSTSHGSGGHSSGGHGSGSASSHSGAHGTQSNAVHAIHEPGTGARGKTDSSEKRGFFSFLRHPVGIHKPKPVPEPVVHPVVDLRHPICLRGPCRVCPGGRVMAGGGCGATFVANHTYNYCSRNAFAIGGSCLLQLRYLDDCTGLRMAMERQERSMRSSEMEQQNACAAGPGQECADLTNRAQSEGSLFRELQSRYRMCRQRSLSGYPFGGYRLGGYSSGLLLDPMEVDAEYR